MLNVRIEGQTQHRSYRIQQTRESWTQFKDDGPSAADDPQNEGST
jgi:hypothetical protein